MARIHFIFLLFWVVDGSLADMTTIPWSTIDSNVGITKVAEPEISAPKPGFTRESLKDQTTESIIALNAKKLFSTRGNKNGFGGALSAPVTSFPDAFSKNMKKPNAPIAASPSQRQMLKIQEFDQVIDRMLAGQAPDSRFMKALNEMMDKSGLDFRTKDMLEGSGEMEINATSNKEAEENPVLGDGSVEDMIRFLCSIFGGNTYSRELIDKVKEVVDRIVSAYEVDCSPVVKASRALLSIIQCVLAGNADSALEQLYPFMDKHYKVLFREVHQFLNIPEKMALSYVESAKEAIRQSMSFISNNKVVVGMVLNFVLPEDDQGNDQFLEKNTKQNGKYNLNDNNSRNRGSNAYYKNRFLFQQSEQDFGIDDGSIDDSIDFSLRRETMEVILRCKQVIELFLNLLRGKRSIVETISLGQKLVEAASPLFRLNEKNEYVHRLVEFLDKALCVMKDTSEADIKSGITKLGRDSTALLSATRRFAQSGGSRESASRMIDQVPACLDRVVYVVNTWDNKRYTISKK